MKNEILKKVISQIKKYDLISSLINIEHFKEWVSSLNDIQISNFINLDIEPEEVEDVKHLLLDVNLLSCEDYSKRVKAISDLKNGKGCHHLFEKLCSPNFLKSKNFYKDIEMLSKAETARYGLWILAEDQFIDSPYHDEDLKLIVESRDTKKEKPLNSIVWDALATVAGNADSINSPYHQEDMKLISKCGSDVLQSSHSYPENSLNNLAVNKVSLKDKYHLENMQILSKDPIARIFMYKLMIDPKKVNGKYYREEIEALKNAKSMHTARALYYYIANPKYKFRDDNSFYDDFDYDTDMAHFIRCDYVSGSVDPDYSNNLIKINQIDDNFVMHYVSLLMNPDFINSPYKKFDLELLESVSDKLIFMDLYTLMSDVTSLKGPHHKEDAVLISQMLDKSTRTLLIDKACNEDSLKSDNHRYDMEFIFRLKEVITGEMCKQLSYYLHDERGINDANHRENLENILQGIIVDKTDGLTSYLNSLEAQLEENKDDSIEIIQTTPTTRPKTKLLSLLKRKKNEK